MQHSPKSVTISHGLPLTYATLGEGSPVIYIHGALTTLDEGLIGLGPALSPYHQLIAFDRPGHGDSATGPRTGSAWRQAELIHDAVSGMGILKPVVIGHSFGGAVAAAYALQFPDDVSGIVALAPIAFPEPRLEQMMFGLRALPWTGDWMNAMAAPLDGMTMPMLWSGMFLPQAPTPAFMLDFPFAQSVRRSQLRADGEEALMMAADLSRSAFNYPSARVRLRVLQGDMDAVVNPLRHGRPMSMLWPDSEFTSLPGLGHMAHHFAPEAVLEAVRQVSTKATAALPLAA